jgi:hypothetical protein
MKPRLHTCGRVENPRDSKGYRRGFLAALDVKPSVSINASIGGKGHQ